MNGNLSLSRALGDLIYKQDMSLPPEKQIVTGFPEVNKVELMPDDEFLVRYRMEINAVIDHWMRRHLGIFLVSRCCRFHQSEVNTTGMASGRKLHKFVFFGGRLCPETMCE